MLDTNAHDFHNKQVAQGGGKAKQKYPTYHRYPNATTKF